MPNGCHFTHIISPSIVRQVLNEYTCNFFRLRSLYIVKKAFEGRKMKDKSLGILLMVIFGLTGMVVIALAWLLPALESDRLVANFAGSIGIFVATAQALRLRRLSGDTLEKNGVKVKLYEKP